MRKVPTNEPGTTYMTKRIYILGLKRRGEDHYGLTTWDGDSPTYYAIYDKDPGYWKQSIEVEPLAVGESEDEFKDRTDWTYIGFGWEQKPEESH